MKKMSKFSLTMGETGLDTPVNYHFIVWVCSYHAPVLPVDKAAKIFEQRTFKKQ